MLADTKDKVLARQAALKDKKLEHLDPQLRKVAGLRTSELPDGMVHEVIHRDDLVMLPS